MEWSPAGIRPSDLGRCGRHGHVRILHRHDRFHLSRSRAAGPRLRPLRCPCAALDAARDARTLPETTTPPWCSERRFGMLMLPIRPVTPEAIEACKDRSEGDACRFETPRGELEGTCRTPPRGDTLACVPEDHRRRGGERGPDEKDGIWFYYICHSFTRSKRTNRWCLTIHVSCCESRVAG